MMVKSTRINSTLEDQLIEATDVGKCFRIFNNSRDRLKHFARFKRKKYYNEYWAVKGVTFSLKRGESLAIVGRNGSGKSTLLQLICGTLVPSEGTIRTKGRIAALLELGSGFNPEFTGRENVFLNASLLGLSRKETNERLDSILAFADIGDFIDQPVKTYSSGMTVRLAFSVIANVDADMLIIDEALAVGDAYFTQKCMRFIQRYREEHGLLFVSHDASAVMSLCDRAMLLAKGQIKSLASPKTVIEEYVRDLQQADNEEYFRDAQNDHIGHTSPEEIEKNTDVSDDIEKMPRNSETKEDASEPERWLDFRHKLINTSTFANVLEICRFDERVLKSESFGGDEARITKVTIGSAGILKPQNEFLGGEVTTLRIEVATSKDIDKAIIGFLLKNDKGLVLLGDNTLNAMPFMEQPKLLSGKGHAAEFRFVLPLLPAGEYSVTASLAQGSQKDHQIIHWLNDALIIRSKCNSIAAGLAGVPMHSVCVSELS